jgi:hypothetical protein
VPIVFVDLGNGIYEAAMPHPGVARVTRVDLAVDGVAVVAKPSVYFR